MGVDSRPTYLGPRTKDSPFVTYVKISAFGLVALVLDGDVSFAKCLCVTRYDTLSMQKILRNYPYLGATHFVLFSFALEIQITVTLQSQFSVEFHAGITANSYAQRHWCICTADTDNRDTQVAVFC